MIYLNNSNYVEVSNVTISPGDKIVTNAIVECSLQDYQRNEIDTFELEHQDRGTYIATIPATLDVEEGKSYILVTSIIAEGLQAEWEQTVTVSKRQG